MSRRQLVYMFMELPHVVRVRIAADLGVVADESLPETEQHVTVLTMINRAGKIEEFAQKVYDARQEIVP
jgi:hypothetical protein